MSDLEGLSGSPKTKEIGGVSLTLKPLTLKDIGLMLKAGSPVEATRAQGLYEVIEKTLKDSYPDVKDPMTIVSIEYMEGVVAFVLEINGMPMEKTPPLQEATKVE